MTTTFTLHTVECALAVEQANPLVDVAAHPDAGWHKCGYYLEPKPDKARLETYVEVPQ